jgi:hypothetical protein
MLCEWRRKWEKVSKSVQKRFISGEFSQILPVFSISKDAQASSRGPTKVPSAHYQVSVTSDFSTDRGRFADDLAAPVPWKEFH